MTDKQQQEGAQGAQGHGRKAVCLVSGGMDSAVVLAEAKALGFTPYALSFRYGQRHDIELEAAVRVAGALGAVDHRTVTVDLSTLGGSALTDDIEVPKDRSDESIGQGVPATYVPARNTIFLSVALGWAEVLGATDLFVGVNAVDYSGYPDCRPEFIAAFENLADLATAAGAEGGAKFRVHAPLMALSKAGIVHRAAELGVDLGMTHTCYDPVFRKPTGPASGTGPSVVSCGRCDACILRLAGFADAGVTDPVPYAKDTDGDDRTDKSALAGVVTDVSALKRAAETCRRAVGAGFHWKETRGALGKLEEELDELREVLPDDVLKGAMQGSPHPIAEGEQKKLIEHELGDVLMAAAFLGGYLGLKPEALCHGALERFDARFRIMEDDLGGSFAGATMDEMLAGWVRAKRLLNERSSSPDPS